MNIFVSECVSLREKGVLKVVEDKEPFFVGRVNNVTVAVGRDADLHCQVENAGEYKVSVDRNIPKCCVTRLRPDGLKSASPLLSLRRHSSFVCD